MTRPIVLVLASDVLFQHFFSAESIAKLDQVTSWTRSALREDSAELRNQIANADVLVTTWHSPFLTREMLGAEPRVKLIAHCGGEVKSRVDEEVFDRITVTNSAGPMAQPVAEMALAMMLTLIRRIPQYAAESRQGVIRTNAEASQGETVQGRRVGVIGFGRIGKEFARLVEPLSVELFVADPYCSKEAVTAHKGKLVDVRQLLRTCSVVVVAAGLTSETGNLLNKETLALMPDGAYLINIARGGIVDMEALVTELRSGRITAALDVTDPQEPLPQDHELRRLPNVFLTPHIAAGGVEMRRAMGEIAVDEVVRFFSGKEPLNVVTRAMLATMT